MKEKVMTQPRHAARAPTEHRRFHLGGKAEKPSERAPSEAPQGTAAAKERGQPSLLHELLSLLIKIAAVCVVFVLVFTLIFGIFRYEDASMSPAIKDGDLVVFYRLEKDYVASDTIILEYEGKTQVRRVIAVAGDEVDITEEGLFINGARQVETSIYQETKRLDTGVAFPLKVGEGQVFVLGDSRENAADSRVYGAVDIDDTLGEVMTVIRRRGI